MSRKEFLIVKTRIIKMDKVNTFEQITFKDEMVMTVKMKNKK